MTGGAALAIWMTLNPAAEADFNDWYPRQHLPERLSVPGFLRGRRYATVGAPHRYFTLYEVASRDVLESPAYLERLNNPTDWTRRVLPGMTRMVRNAYRPIAAAPGDAIGGHVATVTITPAAGAEGADRERLATGLVAALAGLAVSSAPSRAGVVGGAAYATEAGGTSVVTVERRLVGGEVVPASPLLVLCELADARAEDTVRSFWNEWSKNSGATAAVEAHRFLYGLGWLTTSAGGSGS